MGGRVTGLHHVQLAMPEGAEKRAVRFYQDLLGIPQVPKPPGLDRSGVWFESGSLRVHLGVDRAFVAATKAHPALLVTELAVLVERLAAASVEVAWDDRLEGFRRVFVNDPFGNRIELMEPRAG